MPSARCAKISRLPTSQPPFGHFVLETAYFFLTLPENVWSSAISVASRPVTG